MKIWPASLVLALSASSAFGQVCSSQLQEGCFELRALNLRWEAENPLTQGLDKPYRDQAERQDRAQHLAPRLWKGYVDGKVTPSTPRSFVVFLWNVNDVPLDQMSAWRVNGDKSEFRHAVTKVSFKEVKDGLYPTFDPIHNIGKPSKVFRIEAHGPDAIGASLQFPWSMVTDKTFILVCTEDKLTVYPNKVTANEGLWFTPETLTWLRDTRKSKRGLIAFVSKDG